MSRLQMTVSFISLMVRRAAMLTRRLAGRSPKLTMLLGAGFSQALGLPGTEELTRTIDELFDDRLRRDPGDRAALTFRTLAADLRAEFGPDYTFEVLLDSLESSRQFLEARPFQRERSRSSLRPLVDLKRFLLPDGLDLLEGIMDLSSMAITDLLMDRQGTSPAHNLKLARTFINSIARYFRLACIDLNYDDGAERAAPYLRDGFTERVANVDGRGFDYDFLSGHAAHKIVHLHGSVYFRFPEMAGARMMKMPDIASARSTPGWVPARDGAIYSGIISGISKSEKLLRPPYNAFYHWAAQAIYENPRVILIGYGVGDLHLNVWLALSARRHGRWYRLCFITKSDDLDRENQYLQGLLSLAAGFEYVAQVPSVEALLRFDDEGYAEREGLAVLRTGLPTSDAKLRASLSKIERFFSR